MEKPKEIIELEKIFLINITEVSEKEDFDSTNSANKNFYLLDDKKRVIGLALTRNLWPGIPNLTKFKDLRYLDLSFNRISTIQLLDHLIKLEELDLSNNELGISKITGLEKLIHLKKLKLKENQIKVISGLENLKSLEKLDLTNNQITKIKGLEKLTRLKALSLTSNQISMIEGLENLTQLNFLSLINNQISKIEGLDNLKSLEKLSLTNNQISMIEGLENLTQLNYLSLNDNQISKIEGLDNLKSLEPLDLNNNQIAKIEGLENLTQLNYLSLNDNQITKIQGLDNLKSLEMLRLDSNQITKIEGLENLTQLKYLSLIRNQITKIEGLDNLKSLETLSLYNNQISKIEGLDNLIMINVLDIENNQITNCEPLLDLIKKGLYFDIVSKEYFIEDNVIYINNNPLDDKLFSIIKIEDIEEQRKSFIAYYENKKLGEKPFREAKLMLLGEGEAGKTNFRNFLLDVPFQANKSATTGIAIDKIKPMIEGDEYIINIWDFGGQWIQQQVHKFFITNESIYVIILNARNSEEPNKWLKWIESYAPDAKVFVVVNKVDDNPSYQLSENKLRKDYPFIQDFYYISLRDAVDNPTEKEKINTLCSAIKKQVLSLKNINNLVPINYHQLKDDLENSFSESNTHIDYNTYEKLFAKHQLIGDTESYLKILQTIGTLRYFRDFGRLILNPEWLSGGVYKVLMSKWANEKNGIFPEADLSEIMKETCENPHNYKKADHKFIIETMRQFELAYTDTETKTVFIPSLFKADIPTELIDEIVYKTPDLDFIFKFDDYFPEEVISKFIVKFFEKQYNTLYWKNGIVLKNEDPELEKLVLAYVESNVEKRTIRIQMKGGEIRPFFNELKKYIESQLQNSTIKPTRNIVHKDYGELNYDDYILFYKKGKQKRDEVFNGELVEIDIAEVLGMINNKKELKEMKKEKEGNKYDFRGATIQNLSFDGKDFTQTNYNNHYAANNEELKELKKILTEIKDNPQLNEIKEFQEVWLNEFIETLKLITELETVNNPKEEKEKVSKIRQFFNKAKDIKDLVAITTLPIEVITKIDKAKDYCDQIFSFINNPPQ